jgi:SAM-dependent methyltransferase
VSFAAKTDEEAPYDVVASFYDEHWGLDFARLAKKAIAEWLVPRLPEHAAVLDLCCGTGLLLAEICALGYEAAGVDESARMLDIATRNAPRAQLRHADMASFDFGRAFHAVVWLYNSLNHARSLSHLRITLANIAKHLIPGGLLLFDYVLPSSFRADWACDEEIRGEAGVHHVRYAYDPARARATFLIDRLERIRQIPFEPVEIQDAVRAAGLSVLRETEMTGPDAPGDRRLVLATTCLTKKDRDELSTFDDGRSEREDQ